MKQSRRAYTLLNCLLLASLTFLGESSFAKESLYRIEGLSGAPLTNSQQRLDSYLKQLDKPLTQASVKVFIKQVPQNISKAIEPYGYFKSQVSVLTGSTWMQWFVQKKSLNPILIKVNKGPRLRIARLNITLEGPGRENPDLLKAFHALELKSGDVLNTEMYTKAKQALFNAAEHAGYLKARFVKSTIEIDKTRYAANIVLLFDTGNRFYFGPVDFSKSLMSDSFLTRYQTFQEGMPYSTDLVLKFNENLSGSGYFKQVNVNPQITEDLKVPIDVHLSPSTRRAYSVGLGFGTDTGPRGKLGIAFIPVNKQGHKFQALAQGSFKQNQLQSQYLIPGNDPMIDQTSIGARLFNLNYTSGNSQAFQGSIAQIHNKERLQRTVGINALYESYAYTSQPKQNSFLLYPNINLNWIKVSDPLFSPTGYNFSFNALAASKALLSETDVAEFSMDLKVAYQFDATGTRLYFHGTQGITAISNIQQLPLSLSFLLGGTENLKAYGYNSIGPGKILSFASAEFQQETKKNWYLLGFYELGDVYDEMPAHFLYDAGLAIMWVSPVGPIKAGVAQAIDENFQRVPQSKLKFFLKMGPDL